MNDPLVPLEQYKTLMDIAPISTVDVIFLNAERDKTLLFRRVNEPLKGVYFSMGGRLAKGETFIACALRQAKKELGLTLDTAHLVFGGIQEEIHPNSRFEKISYHAVDVFFGYVLHRDEKITLDEQHSEYRWFPVSDETLHPFMRTKIAALLKAYG